MPQLLGNSNKQTIEKKSSGTMEVTSRFGKFKVDLSKSIYFPKGLLGFVPELHFSLINFPKPELDQFKVLQCINDQSISLPVIPASYDNPFIEAKDMEELIKVAEVDKENLLLLFIATSTKKPNGVYDVYINSKAPIIIDSKLQVGIQHVFTSNKYSVRQAI